MSTGEALYLALVIFAMLSFMGTLAWVTHEGKQRPRTRAGSRRTHADHQAAGVR